MIAPLFVGREKSIRGAPKSDAVRHLSSWFGHQKNASDEGSGNGAIYDGWHAASVLQLLKLPDGTVKVLVEGAQRAKVVKYTDSSEYTRPRPSRWANTMVSASKRRP